jgi:hypothetical protein
LVVAPAGYSTLDGRTRRTENEARMSPEAVSALSTVTAGILMLYLGTKKRMIDLRGTTVRCPACGKLYCRGGACPCSRR